GLVLLEGGHAVKIDRGPRGPIGRRYRPIPWHHEGTDQDVATNTKVSWTFARRPRTYGIICAVTCGRSHEDPRGTNSLCRLPTHRNTSCVCVLQQRGGRVSGIAPVH